MILPTVQRQGISWDEQVDIWVARSYLKFPDGWLTGSSLDPSQTRLPAFSVALVYLLFGNSGLTLARIVSCGVGALTLAAVFVYGKRRYDTRRGLLASALLATSPFFLAFARVAFTETDIYLACTLAWLLVVVDRFQDQPSMQRGVWVGVLTGLCISAKFTAIAVLPAVWIAILQSIRHKPELNRQRWLLSWLLLGLWVTALAGVTFLVVPPEHLTNPAILRSLTNRFQHEMTFNVSFMLEALSLHILTIFFKSSLVIGAGLLLSLGFATFKARDWRVQFPVLAFWLYFGCLAVLPLAQTFYAIPLLPLLAIFTADQFVSLWSRMRVAAIGLAVLAVLALGVDIILCYPDYNLNGYQWLGKRMLAGRPSLGYRSVVQTPSDGVEQVIEWLNDHALPGERVRGYLVSWHIVEAVAPHPVYIIDNGFRGHRTTQPEYVVVEINAQIRQSWWIQNASVDTFTPPYDTTWLESNYTKVFTVKRAFGIEMASVYQKK